MKNLKSLADFKKEIKGKKISRTSMMAIAGGKRIIRPTTRSTGGSDSVLYTYDEDGHLLGTECWSGC
ncbi:hypothetical protein EG346_07850 [Chryseobacterium carnipullorum]|uniref:Uncharacterized protein n=1 Tax=Chryseobacterium carnipullorum TaxID=1124835 RepID=A0A1M7ACS3_CHRCU|nr:hypothetical protein [Chryseobacterium carnipullorum]MDN5475452.1 hypothetical protein [Chryseobacterium sp.]AZA48112.1 hypothetical protein EG346_07850 [Chryseobacterium carnipullorum]AZA67424.1 hypothetical protein EG345_24035 [Chryseobacterium carnipullorum]SHL40533.1 hypothetical protein SAMN05444360_101422 [Chryseobacterium carnipullorum]STD14022.1 Uncharacterised protein [Chryseobacterium carnipullorum]